MEQIRLKPEAEKLIAQICVRAHLRRKKLEAEAALKQQQTSSKEQAC